MLMVSKCILKRLQDFHFFASLLIKIDWAWTIYDRKSCNYANFGVDHLQPKSIQQQS